MVSKVIFDRMSHIKNEYIPSELDSWATGFFATLAIFEYLKTINIILTFHNQNTVFDKNLSKHNFLSGDVPFYKIIHNSNRERRN